MAGHVRTVATSRARRTPAGRVRKVREPIPPGEAEQARRAKTRIGARTVAEDRLARTSDPWRRLDIARDYARSAAVKYQADDEANDPLEDAVEALMAAGDRIFETGEPITPAARKTRRAHVEARRKSRADNATYLKLGRQAARQAHADAPKPHA